MNTQIAKPYGYTEDAPTIALPAKWECAYGPFDDEPFCQETEDDGHICPTIRVHRDDAEAFSALVDEIHRLRATVQRITDLTAEHDANTGLVPASELDNALGVGGGEW